jgi:hypothetical protein
LDAVKTTLEDKFFKWIGFSTTSSMGVGTFSQKKSSILGKEPNRLTSLCIKKNQITQHLTVKDYMDHLIVRFITNEDQTASCSVLRMAIQVIHKIRKESIHEKVELL